MTARRARGGGLGPVLLVAPAACALVAWALAACAPAVVPGATLTPVPTATVLSPSSSPAEPTPVGPADDVRVTLGIYSGRPDPTWTLAAAEAALVEQAIEALPEAAGTPPEGGLGYHGFTVQAGGRTITAYLGIVSAGGGGPQVLRADPGRTVERLLLELGRTRLSLVEIAEVEGSLATP